MIAKLYQAVGPDIVIETVFDGPPELIIEAMEARGFMHLGAGPLRQHSKLRHVPTFTELVGPWLDDDGVAYCDFECLLTL